MTLAAAASRWLADAPDSPAWPDPPETSTLHTLLLFVGGPVLIIAVISLLVIAPSLARGPRYRPGQEWDAEPEWLGSGELSGPAPGSTPELTSGRPADQETGGASARW